MDIKKSFKKIDKKKAMYVGISILVLIALIVIIRVVSKKIKEDKQLKGKWPRDAELSISTVASYYDKNGNPDISGVVGTNIFKQGQTVKIYANEKIDGKAMCRLIRRKKERTPYIPCEYLLYN